MKKLLSKWDEILTDYEANVTHIYERRIVHQLFDVVYHSILSFPFKGTMVERGWLDAAVIGDTRTGKSEVAKTLCSHLKVAKPVAAENVSVAGLVGGVQQTGNKWSITWGLWPRLDRRACVNDETTGLSQEQIGVLSDVRSSGKATITKIQSDTTWARVRKLWLANPRTEYNKKVSTYLFGCLVIPEIFGRAEDVARLDLATVIAVEEVPEAVLNSQEIRVVPHKYTSEAAHELVYWCWSRRPDQVCWEKGTENAVLAVSSDLCKLYSSDIPIVEPGEQRIRVARVAVALAARFHSTDGTGEKVRVLPEHVELAQWLFHECYDRPYCGYDRFSKKRIARDTPMTEREMQEILDVLSTYQDSQMLMEAVSFTDDFTRLGVLAPHQVPKLLADLVKLGLLEQSEQGLRRTRKFVQFHNKLEGRQVHVSAPRF
jgi:hypothetical protein